MLNGSSGPSSSGAKRSSASPECIVDKQRDFFKKGIAFFKPMILRDVAETVGMHESTINRVTTNKYVHLRKGSSSSGIRFFNSSIRRMADEDIASESVKQAIKDHRR